MKRLALAVSLAMLAPFGASAQTTDQLVKGATDTSNVLNYGMGYNLQRFSPLTQINKDNAKNLVPVWNYSFADDRSEESQPLVYQGVIYVTTHAATMAVDVKSGKQIWKTKVEYPAETPRIVCCGIINRGAAIHEGKLFRTTLDANVIALDAKTGKELWRQKAADIKEGYSMTVAPLVADGVVLTGISGAEYGTRGFIDGWDPATGKHLWRTHTIPTPDEPGGDTWKGDTCRPIETDVSKDAREGKKGVVYPSILGGKNWEPMSFNPQTGMAYANTLAFGGHKTEPVTYKAGEWYLGMDLTDLWDWPADNGPRGHLKAIDPLTGKTKWEVPSDIPRFSGVLSTAGGVVFSGQLTGEFEAFDANDGKKLWQFQTGSGIEGQPVTWQQDGVQYVAVTSGYGGVYSLFSGDERLANVPAGGSLWVFAVNPQ